MRLIFDTFNLKVPIGKKTGEKACIRKWCIRKERLVCPNWHCSLLQFQVKLANQHFFIQNYANI